MGILNQIFSGAKADINVEANQKTKQGSVLIKCSGCGASNLISSDCACEYCGSPLKYASDDSLVSSGSGASKKTAGQNENIADSLTLTAGFYNAGIDIPIGKCNITAISGNGNLYTSDGELNDSFGTDDDYVPSFKGLKLPQEVTLCVYGDLTIRVDYRSIEGGCTGRTYDASRAIELTDGNYEVGVDIEAGTYHIVAVSGNGNLYSDDGDVNETFGMEDDYVHEIKNVLLPEGAELSLEGGLTIKMTPAAAV